MLKITKSQHLPQSDHWHRWSLPRVGLTPKRAWRSKFLSRARKESDVCFTKLLVWKMITWTPHLAHIPNLAGDKSLLVKVVLNIASFESSEKIFQSLRFRRKNKTWLPGSRWDLCKSFPLMRCWKIFASIFLCCSDPPKLSRSGSQPVMSTKSDLNEYFLIENSKTTFLENWRKKMFLLLDNWKQETFD